MFFNISKYKSKFATIMVLLMAIVTMSFVTTVYGAGVSIAPSSSLYLYKAEQLNIGDYVHIGNYNGRDLSWRVIDKDSTNGVMLRTEYVLSNTDGSANKLPYTYQYTNAPDGYTKNFNNNDRRGSTTVSSSIPRNLNGTSLWYDSSARIYLNNEFLDSFSADEMSVINQTPQVKQLLSWIDVTSSMSVDNVYNPKGTGESAETINGIKNTSLKPADQITGQPTQFVEVNGNKIYAVNYKLENTLPFINAIYDYSPYYLSNDTVFFAPANLLWKIRSDNKLKNYNGDLFTAGLDYLGNKVENLTSVPYSNNSVSGQFISNLHFNNNGSMTHAFGTTKAGYQPSIYIKNDTVLKLQGNAPNRPNETGNFSWYKLNVNDGNTSVVTPQITNTSLPAGRVGELYSQLIYTNTDDVELSVSDLPDGLSFDKSQNKISGTPTKRDAFDVKVSATNNFGSDSKTIALVVNIGDPKTPPNIPQLTATVDQKSGDIVGQLSAGWRFLNSDISFAGQANKEVEVPAAYNEAPDNYQDYLYTFKVRVSQAEHAAPSNPHPALSGRVGQKLSELDSQLPANFRFDAPNDTLKTAGTVTVTLRYNTDQANYSDFVITDAPISVEKGNPMTPPSVPKLEAVYRQSTGEIVDQLEEGWRFESNNIPFNLVTTTTVKAFYNTDTANYYDHEEMLTVVVKKGQQTAPNPIPTFSGKGGQRLGEISLPSGYYRWENPNMLLDSVGDVPVVLYYNTDITNLNDYRVETTINVTRNDINPDTVVIPTNLTAYVGQSTVDIESSLSAGWSFAENLEFSTVGTITVAMLYNPDPTIYNSYEIDLDIRVFAQQQSAPDMLPNIEVQILDTATEVTLPQYYSFGDTTIEFQVLGTQLVTLYYNTNPNMYSNYVLNNFPITVVKRAGLNPDSIPQNLTIAVNSYGYDLKLPEYFRVQESGFRFGTIGKVKVNLLYNQDIAIYEDTVVEVEVTVTRGPTIVDEVDNLLQNPVVLVSSAVGVAFVIFLIIFFIIRATKKGKKVAPVTVAATRPVNYGRKYQNNQPTDPYSTNNTNVIEQNLQSGYTTPIDTQQLPPSNRTITNVSNYRPKDRRK